MVHVYVNQKHETKQGDQSSPVWSEPELECATNCLLTGGYWACKLIACLNNQTGTGGELESISNINTPRH